jgi:Zn finger protein HypA/HybF involved in hydrogenase expression
MKRTELLDKAMELIEQEQNAGLCLDCGATRYEVEPDAEGYECKVCGAKEVAGCEQIVLMFAF